METSVRFGCVLLIACLHSADLSAATTITYQGRLDLVGQPCSGIVNMSFRLYDAPELGSQMGPVIDQSIEAHSGLFEARLDFGQQPYELGLWLQISVEGTTLHPRHEVRSVPLADFALEAASMRGALLHDGHGGLAVNGEFGVGSIPVQGVDALFLRFNVGAEPTSLSPGDSGSIALAALQGLLELARDQQREIEALEAELERQEQALSSQQRNMMNRVMRLQVTLTSPVQNPTSAF